MVATAEDIRHFFAAKAKRVISFAGFGELGYEDAGVVSRVAQQVLAGVDVDRTIVNSGTLLRANGQNGIGEIYRIARELGIESCGIHPSIALDFADTHYPSSCCERVFFVADRTWGGFLQGTSKPSPTLRVLLDVTDELVVIGGGKHAADELEAFVHHNKLVRYFPAEMNHEATREWCERSGTWMAGFEGEAHRTWVRLAGGTQVKSPA